MNTDLETLMKNKSEEELRAYITNASKYTNEAINEAIKELKIRSLSVSDEEMSTLDDQLAMKKQREEDLRTELTWGWDKHNQTTDKDAPELFSQRVISIFSILFSTLAGSILLSINLKRTGKPNGSAGTLIFGIIYTVFSGIVINTLMTSTRPYSSLGIIFGMVGALVLNKVLWKKHLGDIKYKARSVVAPAAICVCITILFVLLMMTTAPKL